MLSFTISLPIVKQFILLVLRCGSEMKWRGCCGSCIEHQAIPELLHKLIFSSQVDAKSPPIRSHNATTSQPRSSKIAAKSPPRRSQVAAKSQPSCSNVATNSQSDRTHIAAKPQQRRSQVAAKSPPSRRQVAAKPLQIHWETVPVTL